MSEERGSRTAARTRVLPETQLLDELDAQEDLAHAKRFAYRAREAAAELRKMGPVVSALGDRIHRLAGDVQEAVAFLEGRAYFEVALGQDRVLARSERQAARIVGEEAALGSSDVEMEVQRLSWGT